MLTPTSVKDDAVNTSNANLQPTTPTAFVDSGTENKLVVELNDWTAYPFLKQIGLAQRKLIQAVSLESCTPVAWMFPAIFFLRDCKSLETLNIKVRFSARSGSTWIVQETHNAKEALFLPATKLEWKEPYRAIYGQALEPTAVYPAGSLSNKQHQTLLEYRFHVNLVVEDARNLAYSEEKRKAMGMEPMVTDVLCAPRRTCLGSYGPAW